MGKGIGGHQRAFEGKTDEWLTPPKIIQSLGEFDLDRSLKVRKIFLSKFEPQRAFAAVLRSEPLCFVYYWPCGKAPIRYTTCIALTDYLRNTYEFY